MGMGIGAGVDVKAAVYVGSGVFTGIGRPGASQPVIKTPNIPQIIGNRKRENSGDLNLDCRFIAELLGPEANCNKLDCPNRNEYFHNPPDCGPIVLRSGRLTSVGSLWFRVGF